ncbi:unnamed protein product [Gordionus sp. m RMFG-2023]|uniref:protein pelota-like n=1 Tax=Gordionus sp. m RMFG-2023 TaxID=3053472 RepID=UPI0030E42485
MKLIYKNIDKERKGVIVLIAEENEDMWHVYNLINEGDSLRASTFRKIHQESATGTVSVNKVRTMLTICVESTDFDTQACVLRVKGRNIEENQFVKMGGYHTLDLEVNRKFTIGKDEWDSVSLERVELACDPVKHADLAAVVLQEGLAHICLVTSHMTLVRCRVEQNIPKKREGSGSQRERALSRFYDSLARALLRHIDFEVVKCVLLASPGFVKDRFFEHLMSPSLSASLSASSQSSSSTTTSFSPSNASMNDSASPNNFNSLTTPLSSDPSRLLIENRSKFLLVHCSTGYRHSLREVLSDPAVIARAADTKAAREVRALARFTVVLNTDPDRAHYGLEHVIRVANADAVDSLLISDSLFRNAATRARSIAVFERVKLGGGETHLFSSLHVSGEQLDRLTGIAAILRYPIPELDTDDDDEDDKIGVNGVGDIK